MTETTLDQAVALYISRSLRHTNPDGTFDKQGRWYPSDTEWQYCCTRVSGPTRAYPYPYMTHCRTVDHVARLTGTDARAIRRAVRAAAPPRREGGDAYYKAVAVVDGAFRSIYDGDTVYTLGEPVVQRPYRHHGGGIYVYGSVAEARRADVPNHSVLRDHPRAILRVRAEGAYVRYENKLAFARVTPLEVVELPAALEVAS